MAAEFWKLRIPPGKVSPGPDKEVSMRRNACRGFSLLEFSAVLPAFIALILAGFDLTRYISAHNAMHEGVKLGLRCAYTTDSECTSTAAKIFPSRFDVWQVPMYEPLKRPSAQAAWLSAPRYDYQLTVTHATSVEYDLIGTIGQPVVPEHSYTGRSYYFARTQDLPTSVTGSNGNYDVHGGNAIAVNDFRDGDGNVRTPRGTTSSSSGINIGRFRFTVPPVRYPEDEAHGILDGTGPQARLSKKCFTDASNLSGECLNALTNDLVQSRNYRVWNDVTHSWDTQVETPHLAQQYTGTEEMPDLAADWTTIALEIRGTAAVSSNTEGKVLIEMKSAENSRPLGGRVFSGDGPADFYPRGIPANRVRECDDQAECHREFIRHQYIKVKRGVPVNINFELQRIAGSGNVSWALESASFYYVDYSPTAIVPQCATMWRNSNVPQDDQDISMADCAPQNPQLQVRNGQWPLSDVHIEPGTRQSVNRYPASECVTRVSDDVAYLATRGIAPGDGWLGRQIDPNQCPNIHESKPCTADGQTHNYSCAEYLPLGSCQPPSNSHNPFYTECSEHLGAVGPFPLAPQTESCETINQEPRDRFQSQLPQPYSGYPTQSITLTRLAAPAASQGELHDPHHDPIFTGDTEPAIVKAQDTRYRCQELSQDLQLNSRLISATAEIEDRRNDWLRGSLFVATTPMSTFGCSESWETAVRNEVRTKVSLGVDEIIPDVFAKMTGLGTVGESRILYNPQSCIQPIRYDRALAAEEQRRYLGIFEQGVVPAECLPNPEQACLTQFRNFKAEDGSAEVKLIDSAVKAHVISAVTGLYPGAKIECSDPNEADCLSITVSALDGDENVGVTGELSVPMLLLANNPIKIKYSDTERWEGHYVR